MQQKLRILSEFWIYLWIHHHDFGVCWAWKVCLSHFYFYVSSSHFSLKLSSSWVLGIWMLNPRTFFLHCSVPSTASSFVVSFQIRAARVLMRPLEQHHLSLHNFGQPLGKGILITFLCKSFWKLVPDHNVSEMLPSNDYCSRNRKTPLGKTMMWSNRAFQNNLVIALFEEVWTK